MIDNIHGAVQAVWDVRRVLGWIRNEDPSAAIGLTGVSLGGYASALVAGFDADLACAILGVPCVDLVELLDHHSPVAPTGAREDGMARARVVGRVVAPLALTPAVPLERRFVYAGVADRLVHPRHQVVRLWEHWGRPDIHWYTGGHVLFSRSAPVGRFLRAAFDPVRPRRRHPGDLAAPFLRGTRRKTTCSTQRFHLPVGDAVDDVPVR